METGGEDRDGGSVVAVVDDFFDPRCESVSVGSSAVFDGSKLGIEPYSVEVVKNSSGQRRQGCRPAARRIEKSIGLNLIALIPCKIN